MVAFDTLLPVFANSLSEIKAGINLVNCSFTRI